MPHKGGKKAPSREDDLEHELEPVRETPEIDMLASPSAHSSASSGSTISGSSIASAAGSSISSEQLERILAATSRTMADSMAAVMKSSSAATSKSMEASMLSILASLTPAVPVAPSPSARSHVKVPKWSDEEIPFEFFTKLEKALSHNGVDKASWGQLLPVYLTGKAQAALAQVPVASLDDYDAVKSVLLESLGDTPTSADRKWWSLYRQSGEDACAFYLRVRAIGIRRLQGLSTKEEILEKLVLSRFMSLLPSDSYSSAMARQPKDGLEAARIVQELEETKAYSRKRQGWRQDHNHHSQSSRREPSVNNSGSPGSGSPRSDGHDESLVSDPGDSGSHGAARSGQFSGNGSQMDPVSDRGQSFDGSSFRERRRPAGRQVTCHGCGVVGHIRPNCPNIIRRVRVPGERPSETVDALLAGRPVSALIDTGSGRTLVHSDFVPGACYTGRRIRLGDWKGGRFSSHRTANIVIQVGDVKRLAEVAVDDSLDCPAALGMDLGADMNVKLASICFDRAKAAQTVCETNKVTMQKEVVEPVRVPRAQAKKIAAVEKEGYLASAQSERLPVSLNDVFNFSDSYFEPDEVKVNFVEASVAPVVCDNIVVPMQQEEVQVNFVEACVAPVVEVKVEVEQLAVTEAQSGNDPVTLSEIFNFSHEFFEDDSLPEPCVRKVESCVPVVQDCQSIEAQADEVASGPVELESVDLSDVFNFSDSFFGPDPVFTPVAEVQQEPAEEFVDITLTKEGTMSSVPCWQSSDLVNSVKCFLHYYTKATRRLAPDYNTVTKFLLFLLLRFLLFFFFVLQFPLCLSKLFVQQIVGASGPRVVLWFLSTGEDLPWSSSSDPLLPRTGIGGFSALPGLGCFPMISPVGCQMLPLPMRIRLLYLLVGCQTLPLHLRPLVKPKGGEMLWSPPLSSSAALPTFTCHDQPS